MDKHLITSFRSSVKNWWVSLIVGIISIVLSIVCAFTPMAAFATLSLFLVISFLIGGISEIAFAVSNRKRLDHWGWMFAMGIIDLIFATTVLCNPLLAPLILSYLIAFWILLQSIWGIGMSLHLQAKGNGWGWLLSLSILGVLTSLLLFLRPEVVILFTAYILSFGFLCYGIFRIYLSFKIKSLEKYLSENKE